MTDKLRKLLDEATPRPWQFKKWHGYWGIFAPRMGRLPMLRMPPKVAGLDDPELDAPDAALIVSAVNNLEYLLAVVEAARALLSSAEGYAFEAKAKGVWIDGDADCIVVAGIIAKLQPALTALDNHLEQQ